MLCDIVESKFPPDYFCSMNGILADQQIFKLMIQYHSKKFKKYLDKVEFDISMFVIPWFLTIFT